MTRFELENRMMACWNIIDDLKVARERFDFDDREDNYMLGLITIYQEKFEHLQECFEELIATGAFRHDYGVGGSE